MTLPPPTLDDMREHAAVLRLHLSDADLEIYRVLMDGSLDVYRALDEIEDEILAPSYPRGTWYRPAPEDNIYNGWATKAEVKGAPSGPLSGRTIVLKDNIALAGVPLLNGTKVLEGYIPRSDATVVTRILDAGGTIVGKAHCEFISGSGGSHTCAWGPVRNPHNPAHMAGGSSSGCAVLVAAGDVDMAIGGDQGGSIRIPASFSGIVGLKPTHGLVPYTGIAPVDPTLDHAGPMTATVTDNALLLSVIAGADGLDPRQYAPEVRDYLANIDAGVAGLRVGIVGEGFGQSTSEADVDVCVRAAADEMRALGAVVEEVSIPMHTNNAIVWMPITAEGALRTVFEAHGFGSMPRGFYAVDFLEQTARWDDLVTEMPANVKAVLLMAEHVNARYKGRYYAKAQNLQRKARAAYNAALEQYDILVMPTIPNKAPTLPPEDASIELVLDRAFGTHPNTAIFDATGHPALSMPVGFGDGLPIGLMMIGKHYDEPTLYRAARALEKHLNLDLQPNTNRR
ncbi:amidase [Sphingobium subterraneum]|uniref:Amidase n=1 Tax=Sphingobium subterraneum TaxID=627688 RepID=A0A841J284_9SPHN|nr:amidase [Sphingobium subterraneum]MBB6125289.1 amidase [Sphingobium subterraneum]